MTEEGGEGALYSEGEDALRGVGGGVGGESEFNTS